MTEDEVNAMLKESGFGLEIYGLGKDRFKFISNCITFAKLVAEKEREACAEIGEDEIGRIKPIYSVTAENIVKAIRARGQQ